jgi:RNA polymerase sigma-70 factor (ECF subfamily)
MIVNERERLFKHWFDSHKGIIFKVVRAHVAGPEDQDDLFQEILLQMWSSIPAFRGEAKESTWIYRVALNTALAWNRTERKRRRHTVLSEVHETHVPNPREHKPERQETVDRLYIEIRKLPRNDRSLVVLWLDGVSYREMAEILGISESNVGVKLNRIKKRLAETMKGGCNGL